MPLYRTEGLVHVLQIFFIFYTVVPRSKEYHQFSVRLVQIGIDIFVVSTVPKQFRKQSHKLERKKNSKYGLIAEPRVQV